MATMGQWTSPQWEALAVVAGEGMLADAVAWTLVDEAADGTARYLWSGLRIALHKDACESYWYNLLSERPYLFVVCFQDEEAGTAVEELMPVLVTAGQDEANAHLESDDLVFSAPMPETIHRWLEAFVVHNYVPERKKKRKRRDWVQESEGEHTGRERDD